MSTEEEREIERMIAAKGLKGRRLTHEQIDAQVAGEQYYRFPNTTVTVCCLTLRNGFNTIGHAASVSAENFDAEIGRIIARNNARQKVWELEGYLLATSEHQRRGADYQKE